MAFTIKRLTSLTLLAMTAMLIAASHAGGGTIDAFINQKMTTASIPGLSAGIVVEDKVTWSKGYGFANIEANRAVTADTPFTLGSISKTFIATALMQAVESGVLSLDTDINNLGLPFVVDNPHAQGEVITLRHLATHTSGLIDSSHYACSYYIESDGLSLSLSLLANKGYHCLKNSPTDLSGFLRAYYSPAGILYDLNNFLQGAGATPGTVWSYSNVAAALAGYLLETATGTALDTHSESRIFTPLRMTNTYWHRAGFSNSDEVAVNYYVDNGQLRPIPAYSLATWPDGGLKSSANDLVRYLAAIMNGGVLDGVRILKSETVNKMLSQQTTANIEEGVVQGLFWIILDSYIGHAGGDPGVSTGMFYDIETDVGVVVLVNIDDDFSNFEDGRVDTAIEEIFFELHKLGNPNLDYDGDGYTENQRDADAANHPA